MSEEKNDAAKKTYWTRLKTSTIKLVKARATWEVLGAVALTVTAHMIGRRR